MRRPSRRSALAVTAIAALGTGGALSSVASATAAQPRALPDLGAVTGTINSLVGTTPTTGTLPTASVQGILGTLNQLSGTDLTSVVDGLPVATVGQLLLNGDPSQIQNLLAALSEGDVNGAIATLSPADQQKAQANVAAAKQQQAAQKPAQKPVVKPTYFTGYRATVTSIRVSKNRRKATIKVSCPASSPKGCYVQIFPKVGGKKAGSMKAFLLARNTTQSGTINLSSSAAKRLKKGGSVQMTAKTALSSLSSATKTVKVAKSK